LCKLSRAATALAAATEWASIVAHGDLSQPEVLVRYCKDGRVAAAAGLGQDGDTAALVELFTPRRTRRAGELGDDPRAALQGWRVC
jgi:hypothetical protein